MTYPVQKTPAQWQALLANKEGAEPLAYQVTQQAATERPFTGKYEQFWQKGQYNCIACDAPLFDSSTKFDAGCGWPSFDQALPGAIVEHADHSLGMARVEIVCANCGAHLGHVFPDGPTDTGLRYCLNSAAMGFDAAK
ncbi:peptide-methionine (R)-S-oxide reductase MsrB [Lampropedia aestuarii]|uniref:peptide-methionine (R)-S-oxide reductase MsrB n=1 Tax=Lampropedia aestuarii TaxID=2562762 RepID=UPI002468995E|nr:peptide-methionine (R)-S-oxide reductase MsrB [Lampropedia aestuarii]MDH5857218.1 peptide-methionine (R)-S-oxide reductase MsrB [Lampropedia aestuarii]